MKQLLDIVTRRGEPAEPRRATAADAPEQRVDHPVANFFDAIAAEVKAARGLEMISCGGSSVADSDGQSQRVGGAATGYHDTGEDGFIPVRVGIQQLEDGSFQLGVMRAMYNPADRHKIIGTGSAADMIQKAGPLIARSFNIPLERISELSGVQFDAAQAELTA